MTLEEKVNFESYTVSFYKAYEKLIELGFDFEKNSAKDLIDCIIYLINHADFDEDIPF